MEKNLVIKALNLLKTQYEIPSLEIHLLKAIPFGAGLGGGSADAAFMLKLLNDFCKLDIHADELEKIAASIGADCPFFIRNTPVFATGTGNIFEPVELSLKGYHFCLIKPDVAVSTPEAYSLVTPKVYASMSGSGSSVFGLFEAPTQFKEQFTDCFVWEGQLP